MVAAGLRVFVNEQPVMVEPGSAVRDAVAAFDGALAQRLDGARVFVIDGVGRRISPDHPVEAGHIYRVVGSVRRDGSPRGDP